MSDTSILPGSVPVDYLALVHVDNVTIVGDGANVPLSVVAGGGGAVVVDGVTIAGAGTEASPLHTTGTLANDAAVTFVAISSVDFGPGSVLSIAAGGGQGEWVLANFSSAPLPLAVALGSGEIGNPAVAVTLGPLTLTISEWDAVIQGGSSTGLTPGATYFLDDAGSNAGFITPVVPTPGSLDFYVAVGFALSTTQLYVKIYAIPVNGLT